jgi:hypothetical protein
MEHSLLKPHNIALKNGIPYGLVAHLCKGRIFYDYNLEFAYGNDKELQAINEMEKSLGSLSPEQINLRVAADFCCLWRYDYPQRIHDICSIIGGSPRTELRLHYQICPEKRQELIDYAEALKGWIMDKAPDDMSFFRHEAESTTKKVYNFLGSKDPLKKLLVERTFFGLSSRFLNCSFWGKLADDQEVSLVPYTANRLPEDWVSRMSVLEKKIQKEMGSDAGDFLCDVGGSVEPACHFKFVRRIDILVSSIGTLRWRANLPPKDGTIKGRRQITSIYLDLLEKYWNGEKPEKSNGDGEEIETKLFNLLGRPDDFKRWLVACLWKNIKNQTAFQAYPMKRWLEFVRIGEDYLNGLK